jgi:cyclophilin family peptidyl-prolyl cis-trans isomerase
MNSKNTWLKIGGGVILLALIIWLFFIKFNKPAVAPNNENLNINTNTNTLDKPVSVETKGSSITETKMTNVKIETSKGDITLELFDSEAPKTVENFITLAKKGFYDGVIFHRVISGFMIQGGDPTGTGRGGPGYQFADELNASTASYQRGYVRGTLAMANAGPNTNGSQFFIMHQDNDLPHNYTIFGRVVTGLEVVDAIAATNVDVNDRPLEEVKMKKVSLVE